MANKKFANHGVVASHLPAVEAINHGAEETDKSMKRDS